MRKLEVGCTVFDYRYEKEVYIRDMNSLFSYQFVAPELYKVIRTRDESFIKRYPLPKNSKYMYGERINSLDDIMKNDFLVFYGRVYNKGWFSSWQFRMMYQYIQIGCLFVAYRKQEYA